MTPERTQSVVSQELLNGITERMLKLFSDCDKDRPDSVLGCYPNTQTIIEALTTLIDVLFPGKLSCRSVDCHSLADHIRTNTEKALSLLCADIELAIPFRWIGEAAQREDDCTPCAVEEETKRVLQLFADQLPAIRNLVIDDVRAAYEGDPAALTYAEVQLAYPGVMAIASHRLAHELYKLDVPIVPRIMSEWVHTKSGTDIHPGARIGHAFFIDHATGVVIGETTEIGDHVKLYQGVTLGARSFALGLDGTPVKHVKRHPTVRDDVIIYAHATILGGETVIGARSVIGSNVFLMESVPADSVVSSTHPDLQIREKKRSKKT